MTIPQLKPYVLAVATALALTAAAGYAQNAQHDHEHATAPAAPAAQGAPADHHAMMMQSMQAEQKKLDDLVTQMNAAKGSDRIDKIAAVVNALAAEHKRMNAMMTMMHGDMMQHR